MLASISSTRLSLSLIDGTEIKSTGTIKSLGNAGEDRSAPLVVKILPAVKTTTISELKYHSIPDMLTQLGVQFSMQDVDYILTNCVDTLMQLMTPTLTKDVAQTILDSVKSKIKSETQQLIQLEHSFTLGSPLNAEQGQSKSTLYYALSETAGVVVAKVYNGYKDDFMREVEVNETVEHGNLVKFIKTFSIQNEARHIIIMPFFPRSVSDWINIASTVPMDAIKVIARSCFDALCHLHSKGFCFADLKPCNIMLQNCDPNYATLVDYSTTIQLGSHVIEFTEQYCLDANTVTATEDLDWICLGTTLAQIGGFKLANFHKAVDLVHEVSCSTQDEILKQLIVSCLETPSLSKIELALGRL